MVVRSGKFNLLWYSGTPIFLPFRSWGVEMPECLLMYMDWWRKKREGKTGIAMNGGLSELSVRTYDDSDSSDRSNSWNRSWRKNLHVWVSRVLDKAWASD